MAITYTNIGTLTGNPLASTTGTITASSGVPAGSVIVVCVDSAVTVTSVTDAASNFYKSYKVAGNQGSGYIFWSYTGNALSIGANITITVSASTPKDIVAAAFYLTGASTAVDPFDATVSNGVFQVGGSTGPFTVASSAPWVSGTMLISWLGTVTAANATGTISTASTGWTIQQQVDQFDATSTLHYTLGIASKVVSAADSLTLNNVPNNGNGNNISFQIFGFSPVYTGISVPQLLGLAATGAAQSSTTMTIANGGAPAHSTIIVVAGSGTTTLNISDSVGNTYRVANPTLATSGAPSGRRIFYAYNSIALPTSSTITLTYTSSEDITGLAYYIETGLSITNDPFDPTQVVSLGSSSASPTISTTVAPWATPSLLVGAAFTIRPQANVGGTISLPSGWSAPFFPLGQNVGWASAFSTLVTSGDSIYAAFKQTSSTETWNPSGFSAGGETLLIHGFNPPYVGPSPLRFVGANANTAASISVSIAQAIPTGSLIVVVSGTDGTISSVSDSVTNTYVAVTVGSGGISKIFYCLNCTSLTTAQTITVSFSPSNAQHAVYAGFATGAGLYDTSYANVGSGSQTSATPTITASATTAKSNELGIAFFSELLSGAHQSPNWVMPSGWTAMTNPSFGNIAWTYNSGQGGGDSIGIAYKRTSAQDTFSPTSMQSGSTKQFGLVAFEAPGAIFSDSNTEAASATDSPSSIVSFTASNTESASATDSEDAQRSFGLSDTEGASAGDGVSSAVTYVASVSESSPISDSRNAVVVWNVRETGNLAESGNAILHPGNVGEETIIVSDSADSSHNIYNVRTSETANLADHPSVTIHGRQVTDILTIRDNTDIRVTFRASVNDSNPLNDHLGPIVITAHAFESISITDTLDGERVTSVDIESASLIDIVSAIASYHLHVDEVASLFDTTDATSTTLKTVESASATNIQDSVVIYPVHVFETITFSEDIEFDWNRRGAVDTISVIDAYHVSVRYAPIFVFEDTSPFSDNQQDANAHDRPVLTESLTVTDFADFQRAPAGSDHVFPVDATDVVAIYNVTAADHISIIDAYGVEQIGAENEHITVSETMDGVVAYNDFENILLTEIIDAVIIPAPRGGMIVPQIRYRSIHDVLTDREIDSDPTMMTDRNPLIYNPPRGQKPKRPPRQSPLQRGPNLTPNLRYISVHDVLTGRHKNSDPTDKDK